MAFLIIKVLGSSSQSTGRSSSPQLQTPSLQDTPALPRSLYVWWGVCVFKQMSEVGDGCFDYFALLTRATWAIVVAGSTIEKGKKKPFQCDKHPQQLAIRNQPGWETHLQTLPEAQRTKSEFSHWLQVLCHLHIKGKTKTTSSTG